MCVNLIPIFKNRIINLESFSRLCDIQQITYYIWKLYFMRNTKNKTLNILEYYYKINKIIIIFSSS